MMNHLENDPSLVASARKPYMKPSVKKVPLRPDEAVLGGCKKSLQGGAYLGGLHVARGLLQEAFLGKDQGRGREAMIPRLGTEGVESSTRALCIRVADLSVSVRSGESGPTLRVEGPSRKFLVAPDGPAEVMLEASWGDLARDSPGPLVFDSGGAWRLYEEPDGQLGFRFFSSNTGASPYLLMKLACDARTGTLKFHRPFYPDHAPVDPLQFPADEVLMVHLLGQGLGVEIHSCGVVG